MTRHPATVEAERPVPVGDAPRDFLPARHDETDVKATALILPPAKKLNFRKLLTTSAALAVLAGAAWYGWDYWTVGQYLVSTDDA